MTFEKLFDNIRNELVNPFIILVFVLGIVAFGWGAVMYLSASQGSDERTTKAKQMMFWAIIGLFFLASMWGIVNLFCNFFGTCTQPR